MSGGIKNWPEDERPREKLLQRGVSALSDAELIAIVLRTGDATAGQTALDLGREFLHRFGSLDELAQASVAEICALKGTGPAKAATILAAFELGRRLAGSQLRFGQDRFTSPEQIFQYYHHRLRSLRKEQFHILLLDSKNRILRDVLISQGSLTQSIVHPREVFSQAVRDFSRRRDPRPQSSQWRPNSQSRRPGNHPSTQGGRRPLGHPGSGSCHYRPGNFR